MKKQTAKKQAARIIPFHQPKARTYEERMKRAAENAPAKLIQEAADFIRANDEEQFAGNLGLARAVWRQYRELVEAEELPERFDAAIV